MKTDGYQQKMPDKHGEFVPWILEGCDILTVKNFMHSADVCLQKHILGGMTPSNSGKQSFIGKFTGNPSPKHIINHPAGTPGIFKSGEKHPNILPRNLT